MGVSNSFPNPVSASNFQVQCALRIFVRDAGFCFELISAHTLYADSADPHDFDLDFELHQA
jgi:hypothetical protein